nr:ACP S-malonyltransferase [Actinomycetota bacterium]
FETVESLASEHNLTVANDNSPRQVVLSGDADALASCADTIRSRGGRCVLLALEGAFHSRAMTPAVRALDEALTFTNIRSPSVPVVANVTALPYRAPGEIRKLLSEQVTERVRFRESIAYLVEQGVDEFVDLGPGSVVGKLARETAENLKEIARV